MNKSTEDYTKDYKLMINELIKIITVLLISNMLMFVSDPSNNKLFGSSYIKLTMVISLGFITYWLIVKNLIIFE